MQTEENTLNTNVTNETQNENYWDYVNNTLSEYLKNQKEDTCESVDDEVDIGKDTVAKLYDFYSTMEEIVLSDLSYSEVIKTLSRKMKILFSSVYVEFLMLENNELNYEYITAPIWMLEITHKLFQIAPVLNMKIPLYEGSFFKEFIDKAKPREIISEEDLIHSIRDFLPPGNPHNDFLRKTFPSIMIKFFAYKYVFQIPLMVNGKMYGYFSFLQKHRFCERTRLDIIMMGGKIADLIAIKKKEEELPEHFAKVNQGFFSVRYLENKTKGNGFKLSSQNSWVMKHIPEISQFYFSHNVSTSKQSENQKKITSLLELVNATEATQIAELYFNETSKAYRCIAYRLGTSRIAVNIEDISEQKKLEAENLRLAQYDHLTKIFNRMMFDTLAEMEIKQAQRDKEGFALFFIDLNGFKQINDSYGHAAGDKILSEVAQNIKKTLRDSDILGRYGGDEFIVLGRVIHNSENAEMLKQKIKLAIETPVEIVNGVLINPSGSIGISLYPEHGTSLDALQQYSDELMYKEKAILKNHTE